MMDATDAGDMGGAPPTPPTPMTISKLVVANIAFGVIGYVLRFYSVSRLTTEWFSVLSFAGIIFGYLYGWIFYHETITWSKLIGTMLIVYSVYNVKELGY
jgi:drug/metabolite transporter (DMT)-like permease